MAIFHVNLSWPVFSLGFLSPIVPKENLWNSCGGFLQARCPSCHPTNSDKELKGSVIIQTHKKILAILTTNRGRSERCCHLVTPAMTVSLQLPHPHLELVVHLTPPRSLPSVTPLLRQSQLAVTIQCIPQ